MHKRKKSITSRSPRHKVAYVESPIWKSQCREIGFGMMWLGCWFQIPFGEVLSVSISKVFCSLPLRDYMWETSILLPGILHFACSMCWGHTWGFNSKLESPMPSRNRPMARKWLWHCLWDCSRCLPRCLQSNAALGNACHHQSPPNGLSQDSIQTGPQCEQYSCKLPYVNRYTSS